MGIINRMRGRFLFLAALIALALPATASAHAVLQRSRPANRAVVKQAPTVVRFTYDDPVQPAPGIAAIRNGGGSVLGGKPRTEGKQLIVPLKRGLGDGVYSVRWQVVSADGHETGGVIAFAVGSGNPVAALSASSGGPSALVVITRWMWFLGLLAAAGIAVFHVVVWRPTISEAGAADLEESERREGSLLLGLCFVLALAGALGLIALSHDVEATRFGRVLIAGAALAGIGAVSALLSLVTRFARPVALLAAVAMLPLPTLAGHALDPASSRLDIVVDVAHVTAAGVWLGGLLALLVIAPRAAAVLGERRATVLRPLAVRFSSLALAAVALLIASGIWRAVVELSSITQLWSTGYGRAILVKSVLLLLTIALAARNRYLFLSGPFSRLRLGVLGESALLLGVVLAVAFLTDLPPGRLAAEAKASAPAPPAATKAGPPKQPPHGALVQAQEDGKLAVALAAQQAPGGRLRLTATVIGPDGNGANGLPVTLDGRPAAACGSGCYRAVVPRRSSSVDVSVAGRPMAFGVPSSSPSAEALMRRATTRFRRLRSVAYIERLSSGPGVHLLSHLRLEAPDKLSYAVRGGSDGVVIGTRRWDRPAGGKWRETATGVLHQPTPIWGLHPQDAHFLTENDRLAIVSFIDRSLPAWFTLALDRRTLNPVWLRMIAPAHFMSHRYTGFNDLPRIRPPR
jgi:copper transport protein